MNKKAIILFLIILLAMPLAVFAGGKKTSNKCAVKYPIVLSHGMGARADNLGIGYWYNIPEALEDEGAQVYISDQQAYDQTADRAEELKQFVLYVLAVSGKSKVSIIGHSHGTLDSRYMISNLGMSSKVASYTSIAGPHRGSALADVILGILPDWGEWIVAGLNNTIAKWFLGDDDPDMLGGVYDMTMDYMQNVFNPNTPNISGIYYQSYAAKIKWMTLDFFMTQPTFLLLLYFEGANDCLVSVDSAKWGNFRGVESGSWWCGGVSHYGIVDQFLGITPGFDAPGLYVDMVNDLKNRGY